MEGPYPSDTARREAESSALLQAQLATILWFWEERVEVTCLGKPNASIHSSNTG